MTTALDVSIEHQKDLGWPKILQALADRASTEPGRDACLDLGFHEDYESAFETLYAVDELVTLLAKGGDLPVSGTREIKNALLRAKRGAVLSPDELVAIAATAEACVATRRHLVHHGDKHPRLGARGALLPNLQSLARELSATFDAAGQIRDDASPELAAARQRLISLHRHMKDRFEAYIGRADLEDVLQDRFYTQREDRYVVPVIASFQKDVPGIIHGASNSGETVFIEPGEFIEGNNAIKVADATVRVETERVLRLRSQWVAAESEELALAFDTLVELDSLMARARLAADLDATVPRLARDGECRFNAARNPHLLLKGTAVVANDIAIAPHESFLVITGPNTGGKTVTLSTVGTFVMMIAAGIPIPTREDSVIAPFSSLSALIGDAQDLDRDLSTFSGHLLAIHRLLDAAIPGALVLLDEIITGTEPTQGASLAISVLESLASRGARGFVTTHYERLKTLPYEDPRFANASVGLDDTTLAPNFVLTQGRPGSSNPFDIALRLGFPPHLIQRAREVAGGHSGLSEALDRLRGLEQEAELARAEARRERDRLAAETVRLQAERDRLKREARAEMEALQKAARAKLREALDELSSLRRDLPEKVKEPRGEIAAQRAITRLDQTIRDAVPPAEPEKRVPGDDPRDGGDLGENDRKIGARVWVRSLNKMGEIVDLRGERATVAVGVLKTSVHTADLGRVVGVANERQAPRPPAPTPLPTPVRQEKSRTEELSEDDPRVPPPRTDDITADLRGKRRDEVVESVEPLIDRAWRDNIEAIWIIHGHGTGALRDEVRELLARSPLVAGFRRGRRHEGGDGVTLAFLSRD